MTSRIPGSEPAPESSPAPEMTRVKRLLVNGFGFSAAEFEITVRRELRLCKAREVKNYPEKQDKPKPADGPVEVAKAA